MKLLFTRLLTFESTLFAFSLCTWGRDDGRTTMLEEEQYLSRVFATVFQKKIEMRKKALVSKVKSLQFRYKNARENLSEIHQRKKVKLTWKSMQKLIWSSFLGLAASATPNTVDFSGWFPKSNPVDGRICIGILGCRCSWGSPCRRRPSRRHSCPQALLHSGPHSRSSCSRRSSANIRKINALFFRKAKHVFNEFARFVSNAIEKLEERKKTEW